MSILPEDLQMCVLLNCSTQKKKKQGNRGDIHCRSAKAGDLEITLGDMVALTPSDEDRSDDAMPQIGMLQALWQTPKAKMMQVTARPCTGARSPARVTFQECGRCMCHGSATPRQGHDAHITCGLSEDSLKAAA